MDILWSLLICLAALLALVLLISFVCFYIAFYVPGRGKNKEEPVIPLGKEFDPYRAQMQAWAEETAALPYRELSLRSFDGLTLWAKFYEFSPGAPIELMFHGYRGTAQRDFCGGVQRAFSLGHSALIVDQRGAGKSGGRVLSFGVKESNDCLGWARLAAKEFGSQTKLILTGISMGAATVLMAAGKELPENVIGILADCGYTSAREIIQSVMKTLKLPVGLLYPFVRLGAQIYGGFCLEDTPPIEVMKRCKLPVLFVHGEADHFVPCRMSRENFEACCAVKRLLTVPGAGHGMSYLLEPVGYQNALREFFGDTPQQKRL